MKKIAVICMAAVLGLAPVVANAQAVPAAPTGADGTPAPSYDYVQQASGMTFDGNSTLTLTGAAPNVSYFSNRPYRVSGKVNEADFVKMWQAPAGFKNDPPNAALSVPGNSGQSPAVLELLSSKVDGSNVVYKVKVVDGNVPSSAKNVSMFVDQGFQPVPTHIIRQGPPPHGPGRGPGPGPNAGAAVAAGIAGLATGAIIASAANPAPAPAPVYTYSTPVQQGCYLNSTHTAVVCPVR
ncbi:hypothetical protein [Roseibium sp. RKSG952]|uniref:hypothetical protein n=1 Tax=Roseibium sp. RKSG952 TaxID=2529384 RepID=UPI001FCB0A47|nr:hypothetical protein [Roseibium sp. RKSG952]